MSTLLRSLVVAAASLLLGACEDDRAKATKRLSRDGYSVDSRGFIQAASKGDRAALERFISLGFNPGTAPPRHDSALIAAVAATQNRVVEWLVYQGVDLNHQGDSGRTPLHHAAHQGQLEVVQLLTINGADLTVRDDDGWLPVTVAAFQGHAPVVHLLVNSYPAALDEALLMAAAAGHAKVTEILCQSGAKVDSRNRLRQTPLMIAAQRGHLEVVRILLSNGSDRTLRDEGGRTAGDLALRGNHHLVIRELLGVRPIDPNSSESIHGGENMRVSEPQSMEPGVATPYTGTTNLRTEEAGVRSPPRNLRAVTGTLLGSYPNPSIWPSMSGRFFDLDKAVSDSDLNEIFRVKSEGSSVAVGLRFGGRLFEIRDGDKFAIRRPGKGAQEYHAVEVNNRRVRIGRLGSDEVIDLICETNS